MLRTVWLRIRSLWQRREVKREIDEALRFHPEQRTAENTAAGMTPEEAAHKARERFGNVQSNREQCRDGRGTSFGETTWQDLRFGARMLRKNPGFTTVAVLALGLGIGANTAVFSLVNAVLLRALPVHDPGQLRVLNWSGPWPKAFSAAGDETVFMDRAYFGGFSYPSYLALREQARGGYDLFAFSPTDPVTAVARGEATRAAGILVSDSFFTGYGASVWMGRAILPEDDHSGAPPVVVITHRWWERHCGSDPGIVGHTLALNRTGFTIVGVLPRDFAGPLPGDTADFYIPLAFQPLFRPDFRLASPDDYWLQIMLRLSPGTQEGPVRVALETVFRRHQLDRSEPKAAPPSLLLHPGARGPWIKRMEIGSPLETLRRIVALVLLIACANVAGLLLARHAARQHELAVRAALGAGRGRLARQVLAECLLLALASAGLGLLLAWWGKALLVTLLPAFADYDHFDFRMDSRVLGFTLMATAATVLLVGAIPAFFASRARSAAGLQNPRILGAPRLRLGKLLVIAQVAISVVLLAGAGLMVRTLVNLSHIQLGFDADRLLVARLNAAQGGHPESQLAVFYERVGEAMAALPGVQSVAFSDQSHVGAGFGTGYGIRIPGREGKPLGTSGMIVSDTFLATMRIPLLLGRGFSSADAPAAGRVAVVNQAFADKMFPGQSPLGETFKLGQEEHQIIGVCGNARLYDFRAEMTPIAYLSYRQRPAPEAWFAIRTALPPSALGAAVRRVVTDLDRNLVVTGLTTQRELAGRQVAHERLFASLGGGLALLAVVIACLGLYGLMTYNVARRTGEIGIRMALGARPADAARWVLREAALLGGTGALLGVVAALGAVRVIQFYLYGVAPHDPLTLAVAVVVLVLVALLAAFLPARRAAKVDPMVALRYE